MNAYEFAQKQAEVLRAKGRQVEVHDETTESGLRIVHFVATAPRWFDHTIMISVVKRSGSPRWRFSGLMIWGGFADVKKKIEETTRSRVAIAVDVYS